MSLITSRSVKWGFASALVGIFAYANLPARWLHTASRAKLDYLAATDLISIDGQERFKVIVITETALLSLHCEDGRQTSCGKTQVPC